MKRWMLVTLTLVLALSALLFAGRASTASADEAKVLEFNSMIGVPRPYTGAANAIRGVSGGGLPWVVSIADGELKSNGEVEVKVRGLVIDPNDATAIARGVAGTNPSANFKVVVSCQSKDAAGAAVTVNVSTGLFAADAAGNAEIEDKISLPSPCIAPIIFVTSPTGAWFASTGF